jgi:hypothetical protein
MIQLGAKVKDCVSGFEGVAVSRYEAWKGATLYFVQAETLNSEGKVVEHQFEEGRLTAVKESKTRAA